MRTDAYLWDGRKSKPRINIADQEPLVKSDLQAYFSTLANAFIKSISGNSEPRIWQHRDRFGQISWHVYDPLSQQTCCFSSEAEVRAWLDQRYSL